MAVTFPLSVADLQCVFRTSQHSFSLGEAMSMSETGGGEILTARRGSRLWSGMMSVAGARPDRQDQSIAFADLIRQPGASFLVYDKRRAYPQSDPGGALLEGETCTVSAIASNRRDVTLAGMPAGYILTRGDMLSIAYGTSPTRFYLGRVLTGGAFVAGSPNALQVEVIPSLPSGIGAADVVTLKQPVCKAIYIPGTYQPPVRGGGLDTGFSFEWRQTLR